MGAMSGARGVGHDYRTMTVRVVKQEGDAKVAEYVVGTVPEDVVYANQVCTTINQLPEKFHEAAMLLYAAVSGEVSVRIPGMGSVRRLEDGCLYFCFYD